MREAGLDQLQTTAIDRKTVVAATNSTGQAVGAEPTDDGSPPGVVEIVIQNDVKDVVEEHPGVPRRHPRRSPPTGPPKASLCGAGSTADRSPRSPLPEVKLWERLPADGEPVAKRER
jgi:hypothetical protein